MRKVVVTCYGCWNWIIENGIGMRGYDCPYERYEDCPRIKAMWKQNADADEENKHNEIL